jgi:hypothetical protein
MVDLKAIENLLLDIIYCRERNTPRGHDVQVFLFHMLRETWRYSQFILCARRNSMLVLLTKALFASLFWCLGDRCAGEFLSSGQLGMKGEQLISCDLLLLMALFLSGCFTQETSPSTCSFELMKVFDAHKLFLQPSYIKMGCSTSFLIVS